MQLSRKTLMLCNYCCQASALTFGFVSLLTIASGLWLKGEFHSLAWLWLSLAVSQCCIGLNFIQLAKQASRTSVGKSI